MSKKTKLWGATQDEWDNLSIVLGQTTELLPVVSNPHAVISAGSKMKRLGKTPSVYSRAGEVYGFPDWTEYNATDADIAKWRKNPDYGICHQTRALPAIDVDVKDAALAQRVMDFICARYKFPIRYRADSSKFLMAFRVRGEISKTVLKLGDGNAIEFLGKGQQFIAHGTHQDGARYEWDWQGLNDFPEITIEEYQQLLADIAAEFATEIINLPGAQRKARGGELAAGDDVTSYLYEHGLALGEGRDGSVYLECPWSAGHSVDSGETQTAYFPPGRGYARGHFKCMHAGCAQHSHTDFIEALGIADTYFDVVPEPVVEKTNLPALPLNFRRYDKQHKRGVAMIYAELENLEQALERPEICGYHIRYDEFEGTLMFAAADNPEGWVVMSDAHQVEVRCNLEKNSFGAVGRELMRDALVKHARRHSFDSAIEWLTVVVPEWDGVDRVGNFLADYFCTEESEYTRAVSRYLWTALAGRVLEPGVKADMAPILVGPQGVGKSMGVASLVPSPNFAGTFSLASRDNDLSRMMKAKLIIELPELAGMRAREREEVKSYISLTVDEWIEKYQVAPTKRKRRSIFIGTTNEDEFLDDTSGERRWLPARILREIGVEGIKRIQRDRTQLWAQARDMFLESGVDWAAQKLALPEHAKYKVTDPWDGTIDEWLDTEREVDGGANVTPRGWGAVTVNEVAQHALFLPAKNCNKATQMRITDCLKRLGWVKHQGWVNGIKDRWWLTPQKIASSHIIVSK